MNQTPHFNLKLMHPLQQNKELIYNETISKIDILCNNLVDSFVDKVPKDLSPGKKYILDSGQEKNAIVYCLPNKGWQYFYPVNGATVFVQAESKYYYYLNNNWKPCYFSTSPNQETNYCLKFVSESTVSIPANSHLYYIDVQSAVTLDLSKVTVNKLKVIIKYNAKCTSININQKVTWNKQHINKYLASFKQDSSRQLFIILKFYPLPSLQEFLAEWTSFYQEN